MSDFSGVEKHWWWLSFAGDEGSRGIAIVQGDDITSAIENAHRRGINPGGEVLGYPCPDGNPIFEREKRKFGVNRLVKLEELQSEGYKKRVEVEAMLDGVTDLEGRAWNDYENDISQVVYEEDNKRC